MFAGHFGLAAIVKTKDPELPLWLYIVATQLLDLIFIPLWLFHIETLIPIGTGGYGKQIIHADYTHSLIGALVISILSGYMVSMIWKKRGGIVFGLTVFSHWILDLIVHRTDMPILPANWGNLPLLGFGLWQLPVVSKIIELSIIALGTFMYINFVLHAKVPSNISPGVRIWRWVQLSFVVLFLFILGFATT